MIAKILRYKGYTVGPDESSDAIIVSDGVVEKIVYWNHVDPQPTTQQIQTWSQEPGYLVWLNENGSDPVLTARRQAKKAMVKLMDYSILIRAIIYLIVVEINLIRSWIRSFKEQTAGAASLADFKSRVAGLPDLQDRTMSQVKTQLENIVDNGLAE